MPIHRRNLIKSLPKNVRRGLVPVPDTAKKTLGELRYPEGCLSTALAHSLTRVAGTTVSADQACGDVAKARCQHQSEKHEEEEARVFCHAKGRKANGYGSLNRRPIGSMMGK